jgi:hypothetical protein
MAINDALRASEPKARSNRCDLIKLPFISIPPFELLAKRVATLVPFLAFVVAAFPDLLLPPSEFIAATLRGLKVAEKSDQNNNGDRNS